MGGGENGGRKVIGLEFGLEGKGFYDAEVISHEPVHFCTDLRCRPER